MRKYTKNLKHFESADDEKRKEVLGMVGQNLTYKDGKLEFEAIKYLTPIVEKYPELEKQYISVQTQPQQMKKDAVASIISNWYAWQDLNLRPQPPQGCALIQLSYRR